MRRALWCVVALGACTYPEYETNETSLSAAVLGGSPTKPAQFPTVVAIDVLGSPCTGVLVSPTKVLTAASCIDPDVFGLTIDDIPGVTTVLLDTLDVRTPVTTLAVAAVIENPRHPDFLAPLIPYGGDDDALIVLAEPVSDRISAPLDLTHGSKLDEKTTHVGYGLNRIAENDPMGAPTTGVQYYLSNRNVARCQGLNNFLDAKMLCIKTFSSSGSCNDTGAPAFDELGHVIGLVSTTDISCAAYTADTRVSQTATFLVQNIPELADGVCVQDNVCNLSCANDPDCVTPTPYCGDGNEGVNELCDLGSSNGFLGSPCSAECTPVLGFCGNGRIEDGEECDFGSRNGLHHSLCTESCTLRVLDSSACDASGPGAGLGTLVLLAFSTLVRRRRDR